MFNCSWCAWNATTKCYNDILPYDETGDSYWFCEPFKGYGFLKVLWNYFTNELGMILIFTLGFRDHSLEYITIQWSDCTTVCPSRIKISSNLSELSKNLKCLVCTRRLQRSAGFCVKSLNRIVCMRSLLHFALSGSSDFVLLVML